MPKRRNETGLNGNVEGMQFEVTAGIREDEADRYYSVILHLRKLHVLLRVIGLGEEKIDRYKMKN